VTQTEDDERRRFRHDRLLQQQKAGADFAVLAIRTINLASGGAVIAVLTFLGNLWTKQDDAVAAQIAQQLKWPIILFAVSFVLSVFTAAFAYISALAQAYYLDSGAESWLGRNGRRIRLLAIVLALTAAAIFGVAAIWAAVNLQKPTTVQRSSSGKNVRLHSAELWLGPTAGAWISASLR
jgi:hypothetical protein